MANFPTLWKQILMSNPNANATDAIASVTQDFINEFLATHFKQDSSQYSIPFKRTFTDSLGKRRDFTLVVTARKALQAFLPPNIPKSPSGPWEDVPQPFNPKGSSNPTSPNIYLQCQHLEIDLKWPKLTGGGYWQWNSGPLRIDAKGFLELRSADDRGTVRYSLFVRPVQIALDVFKPTPLPHGNTTAFPKDATELLAMDNDAFRDLLVIAFNVVAYEYGPKLAQSIEIPTIVASSRVLYPSLLDLSDGTASFGLSLDRTAFLAEQSERISREMQRYSAALKADVVAAGGSYARMVLANPDAPRPEDYRVLSQRAMLANMPRVSTLLDETQKEAEKLAGRTGAAKKRGRPRGNWVKDGAAVGVSEYLFDALLSDALPKPTGDCTDWLDLALVRGRACYWASISNSDVTINTNATVTGSALVDVGGKLEACIRRFWDCSWQWACGSLSIGVVGVPTLTVTLDTTANGVVFRIRLGGGLSVETNLPFPFNLVVEAILTPVVKFLYALLQIAVALARFTVLPADLHIPGQNTQIALRANRSFYLDRPGAVPVSRGRMIGITADVDAY